MGASQQTGDWKEDRRVIKEVDITKTEERECYMKKEILSAV